MKNQPHNFKDTVINAITRELTLRVGYGLEITVPGLAEAIAESERSIYSYKSGESMMPLHKFLNACRVLGPAFTNNILRLAGIDGAQLIGARDGNMNTLNADLAACSLAISTALADGKLCHQDKANICTSLDELEQQIHKARADLCEVK